MTDTDQMHLHFEVGNGQHGRFIDEATAEMLVKAAETLTVGTIMGRLR